jgi:hypothetical protein
MSKLEQPVAANNAEPPRGGEVQVMGWLRHPNAAAALGTPRLMTIE